MQRITGQLTSWKDDKGYGFISGETGAKPCFVHISAFGTIARRPQIGDTVEFGVATAADGKKQAVQARILGLEPARAPSPGVAPQARRERPRHRSGSQPRGTRRRGLGVGVLLPLVIAAGIYAYFDFRSDQTPFTPPGPAVRAAPQSAAAPRFHCAGKTRCSQMNSCDEALFYLRNCPNTEMDGDRDGIPCESQWCGR